MSCHPLPVLNLQPPAPNLLSPVPICPSKVSVSRTFLGCGQDRTALCISPISERR